ncbi:hypothetical protein GIB67_034075 [Kingdonia uniflora]|uniref:DEAD/DEAH box helicase domain-containing protein n=1 Tax=Kingdonia uniflora TaxID=39325 RepID=A0A7J7M681_9MAGN|nr:hypothetical protein GIB67_034075 [Kingdonia uniflora]
MAKGDDAIRKKKNKLLRKKMRSDSSNAKLTARLASITASRNRRKAGKRRISEGMCFSLPTLEDPFNDRSENKILHAKKKAKKEFSGKQRDGEKDTFVKKNHNKSDLLTPVSSEEHTDKIELQETGLQMLGKDGIRRFYKKSIVPSKFLSMCLDSIKEALAFEGNFIGEPGRSLTFNSWGVEFWKCCQIGLDIVETGGACASTEQIALVISTAADIISKSEKDGLSIGNPFLLILVPTQPKAMEIRSVCKPLKDHGIHTVSVHTGALIDHQIQG